MALENYRPIQFPEKTNLDNTDVVLIDSASNGTNKYQLSRIQAQASAEAESKVSAEASARQEAINDEASAREAADSALREAINTKADNTALAAETTARQNADEDLQEAIEAEESARESYGFSVVDGVLNVTFAATV